ncbi:MAG: glycosyltransferase family 2 protein [Proteobacteria bacterium]|nr:glycosyltransferase family 2 protein [Pseudomonadota bacterium]
MRLSVICPVYNERETIPLFFERFRTAMAEVSGQFDLELIFVDNCSDDGTPDAIRELHDDTIEIFHIRLARNFGYQSSLVGGLTYATGDLIVNIDVDCEDPPELIPRFLDGWRSGYDVVYGIRQGRPESMMMVAVRKLFYRITRQIADSDFVLDMAEFVLMTRQVRDAVLRTETSFPFIRSEIGYAGFRRMGIAYDRQPRIAGVSNYNLPGLVRFAVAGMLSASTAPLRLIAYFGLPLGMLNLAGLLAALFVDIPTGFVRWVEVADLTFLILSTCFLAIYLARIYKNGLMRPNFIVDSGRSRFPPRRSSLSGSPEHADSS